MKKKIKEARTLGNRIKYAREYAGLSQTELGEKTGVALRQVQRWEANEYEPKASHLEEISAATGCTVNWLLGDYPRLPDTWTPQMVLPNTNDAPETAETAKELIERATGEEVDLEEVEDGLESDWITWENSNLVLWEDGLSTYRGILDYLMLIK